MFLITKKENDMESGAYASLDDDGTPIVQFFRSKDDAMTFYTQLEALGLDLAITETNDDMFDKFCGALGHAYTVVDEGEMVIPRFETLQSSIVNLNPFNDYFSDPDLS